MRVPNVRVPNSFYINGTEGSYFRKNGSARRLLNSRVLEWKEGTRAPPELTFCVRVTMSRLSHVPNLVATMVVAVAILASPSYASVQCDVHADCAGHNFTFSNGLTYETSCMRANYDDTKGTCYPWYACCDSPKGTHKDYVIYSMRNIEDGGECCNVKCDTVDPHNRRSSEQVLLQCQTPSPPPSPPPPAPLSPLNSCETHEECGYTLETNENGQTVAINTSQVGWCRLLERRTVSK